MVLIRSRVSWCGSVEIGGYLDLNDKKVDKMEHDL